jgi:hypothetical protein
MYKIVIDVLMHYCNKPMDIGMFVYTMNETQLSHLHFAISDKQSR